MADKKTAFITGISGQDGAWLAKHLLGLGYRVVGGARRSASGDLWRLDSLRIRDAVEILPIEMLEIHTLTRALRSCRPHEVYNLAAQSFVGSSFECPLYTLDTNSGGTLRTLEAIREVDSGIKFYQASTSEMFGKVSSQAPLDESSPFHPRSPYGVAKLAAHWATVNYREAYGMYAVSGILFNHESSLRGPEFVTQKIVKGLAKIRECISDVRSPIEPLLLGNLDAKRDWGHAEDYVTAMHLMLQQDTPRDYVISSGETRSVREFLEAAVYEMYHGARVTWTGSGTDEVGSMNIPGIGERPIVKVSPQFYRPAEVDVLLGDSSDAQCFLGWRPQHSFRSLVSEMVSAELERDTR